MTRLPTTEIVLEATPMYAPGQFTLNERTTATGSGPEQHSDFIVVPQVALSTPLSERWRFGFSLNIPMGIGANYGDNWAGRYISQESELVFIAASPTVAYRVNDWLSLGAGPYVMYVTDSARVAVNNVREGLPDGQIEYDASGAGVGFTLSALVELSKKTRIGVNYRSETEPNLETVPRFKNIGPLETQLLINAGVLGRQINIEGRTPQNLWVGIYQEVTDNLSVTLDGMWVDFSRFGLTQLSVGDRDISFKSQYQDMYGGSAGAKLRLSEQWATSVGAMYISSGVDDENRTLALPLDQIYGFGVGVEHTFDPSKTLQVSLNYLDTGQKKIDQEQGPLTGRIVGDFEDHYAVGLDIAFVWRF
jgi:long-chain fatty acid transport protein